MTDSYTFSKKFAFLDTNIVSEMARSVGDSSAFSPVFEFLKDNQNPAILIDATRYEFTGYTQSKQKHEERKQWLERFPIIPMQREDVEMAAYLSSIYKQKNPRNRSLSRIVYMRVSSFDTKNVHFW